MRRLTFDVRIGLVTLMICLVMIATVVFGFRQRNEIVVVPIGTVFAFTQLRSTMPGAPEGFSTFFILLYRTLNLTKIIQAIFSVRPCFILNNDRGSIYLLSIQTLHGYYHASSFCRFLYVNRITHAQTLTFVHIIDRVNDWCLLIC